MVIKVMLTDAICRLTVANFLFRHNSDKRII
jgi:hypothetical protein